MSLGKLYLIPTTLGGAKPLQVLPVSVKEILEDLEYFIVEREKTARAFIKKITPNKKQASLKIYLLNKHTNVWELQSYLDICKRGTSLGLLSEAGIPTVADPGSEMVRIAHKKSIQVVPLVGPCSIVMALMASGMNGQNFAFNGYLPIEKTARKQKIKYLENASNQNNQSQIFMETPYRNQKIVEDLIHTLNNNTRLCIATDITLPTEKIHTFTIQQWKNKPINLQKRPTIFIIHKD